MNNFRILYKYANIQSKEVIDVLYTQPEGYKNSALFTLRIFGLRKR